MSDYTTLFSHGLSFGLGAVLAIFAYHYKRNRDDYQKIKVLNDELRRIRAFGAESTWQPIPTNILEDVIKSGSLASMKQEYKDILFELNAAICSKNQLLSDWRSTFGLQRQMFIVDSNMQNPVRIEEVIVNIMTRINNLIDKLQYIES